METKQAISNADLNLQKRLEHMAKVQLANATTRIMVDKLEKNGLPTNAENNWHTMALTMEAASARHLPSVPHAGLCYPHNRSEQRRYTPE